MTRTRWLAAALAAVALAAAGCGGDDEEDTGGNGETTTAIEQDEVLTTETGGLEDTAPETAAAKDTFAATCGGCHTLKAAGTNGQTGPNLDELKPDIDRVRAAIKEGPDIMPENLLEGAEAQAVAEFVATNAGG